MSKWAKRAAILATAALLAIPAHTVGAVDLGGTTWDLSGPERLVVRRLGRDRGTTDVTATFREGGTFGIDQDGNEFGGTYSTRGNRGVRISIRPDADAIDTIEDWLADWIEEEAADRGQDADVSVSLTRSRISGTINRAGTRATVFTRYSFVATVKGGNRVRGVYWARLRGQRAQSGTTR